jgi:hypothetical protein
MKFVSFLVTLSLSTLLHTSHSEACGRFVARDADGFPIIDNEESVIVWDAENGIEHFIRRVHFDKAPRDFAFVIPVPNIPDFAEAPGELIRWIQAEMPVGGNDGLGSGGGAPRGSKGGVQIVKTQDVAGLNATVVQSDSSTALQSWLEKNGYAVPKDAQSWIKTYVDRKWSFVALKLKPTAKRNKTPSNARAVASPMLRISFKTPKPFFPYREFESRKAEPGREFSLYLIAPSVLSGHYENGEPWKTASTTTHLLTQSLKAKSSKNGYVFEISKLEKYLDKLMGKRAGSKDLFIVHFQNYDERRPYAEDLYFDSK